MMEGTEKITKDKRCQDNMIEEKELNTAFTVVEGRQKMEEGSGAKKRRIMKQIVMVLGASVCYLGVAVVAAWPNVAIIDFKQHNTTIYNTTIALTPQQTDMLGSLVAVGNLPGTWAWGWVVWWAGRRKGMMLLLVPYTLGWALVALAPGPTILLIGRVIHGVCIGATFVSASTYIIELPDIAIRGAAASISNLALNLGFVITVVVGLALRWYEVAFVGLSFIFIHTLLLVFFLPESPSFLTLRDRKTKARKILLRLRGPDADVEEEMANIIKENKGKTKEPLLKVLRDTAILKSLGIVITLFFVQNFCGLLVFSVNMTRIFQSAGTNLSGEISSIIVFLVQMAGTFLACIYLDKFGRRPCLMFSLSVMSLCLLVMGFYQHCKDAVDIEPSPADITTQRPNNDTDKWCEWSTWLPLGCLTVYMFTSSVGAGPVPSILNLEYFPTAVRAQLSGICMVVGSVFNVAALQLYSSMQDAFTPAGLYWFYAAVTIFGVAFTFLCVRETKGVAVG